MRHSRGGLGVHGGGGARPPARGSGAGERKAEDERDGQTGPPGPWSRAGIVLKVNGKSLTVVQQSDLLLKKVSSSSCVKNTN